ncbi:hypothetical protein GGR54DRAFT_243212 [Hypoxylon sp. NC1633]|nr:hypothetical protein GGR54DRAFT_243212 [Hypoxylon sp. NC1633]
MSEKRKRDTSTTPVSRVLLNPSEEGCYGENSDNPRSSLTAHGGEEKAQILGNDNTAEETMDLKPQLEATHERIRQLEMELASKEAGIPQTETTYSSHEYTTPSDPVNPVISLGETPVNNRRPLEVGTLSSDCVRKLEALQYYGDLDGIEDTADLDELRCLARNGKDTRPIGHTHYHIFLKTGAIEDLEHAIDQVTAQMPTRTDDPHYTPRLKDLIVMLVKKFRHTGSVDDLQGAIFRAQEMMVSTPPEHPDRSARMRGWVDLLFIRFRHTGLQDDLDEAVTSAREAGVVVSIIDESDGIRLQFEIPRYYPYKPTSRND